jgi:peptidoglycan hydrolase-like protein with peptidoglycan-binding domain
VAVGIGTIGAVTTAYQLAIKQRADRKIDRIVHSVQDELKGRGLYSGEVDGILGPETKNAIAKVQEDDTSLQVTGELDDKTLGSIINATGSSPSG